MTRGVAVGFRPFPDHHPYDRNDVAELARWVREQGADLALTTQKDLVKLRTPDLGGTASTRECGAAVVKALRSNPVVASGRG